MTEFTCANCGHPARLTDTGIANHTSDTTNTGIDHDRDADHVPYTDHDVYNDPDQCIALGLHNTSCDEDGYCNHCGHGIPTMTTPEDDEPEQPCTNCGTPISEDGIDATGSRRCDDTDPHHRYHAALGRPLMATRKHPN